MKEVFNKLPKEGELEIESKTSYDEALKKGQSTVSRKLKPSWESVCIKKKNDLKPK